MIVDTHPEARTEPNSQKKAWDAPKAIQLQAGSAEFEVGSAPDGTDKS